MFDSRKAHHFINIPMPNNFCRFLTNQVRIEYGYMKPCCWFRDSDKVPIDNEAHVKFFRDRLSAIASFEDADGACDECANREKAGSFSPRLESLSLPEFADDQGTDVTKLEIQIDRDCNGACLICGPWNSSTWEKYKAKTEAKINGTPIQEVTDTYSATQEQIKKLRRIISLDQARSVLFLGGEPLRNDHHMTLLKDVAHPELMVLNYTTNGSCRPDPELLEFWKQFKKVTITFSIDGVGEHFDYLRWPLQWHQVESNIRYLFEYNQANVTIVRASYTTTPLSLYYHDRYQAAFEQFAESVGHVDRRVNPWFERPWQPRGKTPMALSAVPPALAELIRERYGPDHSITKLLEPFDPAKHEEFKRYIAWHDSHRNTSWQETFPEMIPFYS